VRIQWKQIPLLRILQRKKNNMTFEEKLGEVIEFALAECTTEGSPNYKEKFYEQVEFITKELLNSNLIKEK